MTTWHRTDDHGIPVQFTATPDDRGNVQLTREELEGLMRAGGWEPGPIPPRPATRPRMTISEFEALSRNATRISRVSDYAAFAQSLTRR